MRSLLNEYSFLIFFLTVMLILAAVVFRFGGVLRIVALGIGCLLIVGSVFVLTWNRSSDNVYYTEQSLQDAVPLLTAPAVIQFYSNY